MRENTDQKKLCIWTISHSGFLIVGNFNFGISKSSMHEFCSIYNLHNLCGNVTLYENLENHDASTKIIPEYSNKREWFTILL